MRIKALRKNESLDDHVYCFAPGECLVAVSFALNSNVAPVAVC
jgi:hypothetical protein